MRNPASPRRLGLYGAAKATTARSAAASIGLINLVGNMGGFVGPYAIGYLRDKTGGFGASLLFLSVCSVASGLLVLCVRLTNENIIVVEVSAD